jgi:hypothetical protein
MLLFPAIENKKAQIFGGPQCYNTHIKFNQNAPSGSRVEICRKRQS